MANPRTMNVSSGMVEAMKRTLTGSLGRWWIGWTGLRMMLEGVRGRFVEDGMSKETLRNRSDTRKEVLQKLKRSSRRWH